jgi:hypothetical protein
VYADGARNVTITHIKDLNHDGKNARAHTVRNVGMLEQALNEVGAARSIVIDEDGTVLAGNATMDAAVQAGITRVQVVDADGETLIAVRRTGLTDEQKVKLALFDNRVSDLSEWDAGVLAEIAEEIDLSSMFFPHELANILEHAGDAIIDANELWKGMPDFEQEDKEAYQSIHVHFKTKDDVEEFARLVNQTITDKTRFLWFPYIEIERYADKSYSDES